MKTKSYPPASKGTAGRSNQHAKDSNSIPDISAAELESSTLELPVVFENAEEQDFPLPLDRIVDIGQPIKHEQTFSINIGHDSIQPLNLLLNAEGDPEINGTSQWLPVSGTVNKFQYGKREDFRVCVALIAEDGTTMQIILVGTVPTLPDDHR